MLSAKTVTDAGEGPASTLFSDQTEARTGAKKKFFGDRPPARPPPSPYQKVWVTAPHLISSSGSGTEKI